MITDKQQELENLAYEAWLRRGQPIGSPDVDWEEALRLQSDRQSDEETVVPPSGGAPTDLGADLLPETSHDQTGKRSRRTRT